MHPLCPQTLCQYPSWYCFPHAMQQGFDGLKCSESICMALVPVSALGNFRACKHGLDFVVVLTG